MDDLTLIFSHHQKNTTSTSRKRPLHEEDDDLACIISFENSLFISKGEANNSISFSEINNYNENIINIIGEQFGGNSRRTREQAQEHLLAERKRRQKISKLFASLASLLPGLNKMDKASILEGATNLIRQLGERVETIQQNNHHHHLETTNTNNEEKKVKKAQNYENQYSSIDMMMKSNLPQVEVKSLEEELLITILYCKKQQKGNVDEILSVIQKLHLTIKTTNFMPFGNTSMHITVIAQMNAEFCETTDYLAEKLRSLIIKV